jgi:glutathione S-transferase
MAEIGIIIGNKTYSSWSLRGWLALQAVGVPFEEVMVRLYKEDSPERLREHSPSGRVPALRLGRLLLWDSLAIAETLADRFPAARLWPDDPDARAVARSVSAEMHAGFADLRGSMPMDLKRHRPGHGRNAGSSADIERILNIWRDARARFGTGGPFLFGRFSIADAMYAPVVTRFATYGVELDPVAKAYAEAITALPAMQAWTRDALAEPWVHDYD